MTAGKVFTDEELREMGVQTAELIQAAIDANDKEKAKKLTRRMYRESLAMHDLYRDWTAALLSFIGRRYGDEALQEALKESCAVWLRPVAERYGRCDEEGNPRRKAELLAGGLRGHLMPLKVEEDEEKFIFQMQPCGSGGRLVLEGYYESPVNLLKIEKPQPMTCGQKDFPVYCAHGPVLSMLGIEWSGAPIFFEEPSAKVGEKPCKIYLYKDPKRTPAELYAKVGKEKTGSRDVGIL